MQRSVFCKKCPIITNPFLEQEYPTYTILGQSQYQTCYPSSGFGVVAPADGNAESAALQTTAYPAEKPNAAVPARMVQRHSSGNAWGLSTRGKHYRENLFLFHVKSLGNWPVISRRWPGNGPVTVFSVPFCQLRNSPRSPFCMNFHRNCDVLSSRPRMSSSSFKSFVLGLFLN